ncbi:MAG TPA: threonine--tRNA ligase [bacterium]|nr:threonine--tRNA ligase [bacterium]HPL95692.1 threonine--tRNA ligase [bacterium]
MNKKVNQEKESNYLLALRHSTEHVLTMAVLKLYPEIKMAMGPATDDGFYFDFDSSIKISEEDFPKIEAEMEKIIKADLPIIKKEISVKEARELFKANEYKQEWLDEIEARGEKPTVYWTGDRFVDLCAGPHVKTTGEIKAFKLMKMAGAYWHGNEKNKMLTRIYGTAYESEKELGDYLKFLIEAEKRDHRKIGKEFDLFTFSELVGSGLPLYTPKGAFIRQAVNNYVEQIQTKHGYTQVWTPQIAKAKLFQTSGHYDKYKDGMFRVVSNYSNEEFFLKPMNCPQHTQIYLSQPKSYRDLPVRYTDFAMLYRDEKPGELNGLARVRSFSQDDCHIFCREDQVDEEIDMALNMTKKIMATFGFKYRYRLSTRDPNHLEKYLGDPKVWDKVEKWAEKIMKRNEIDYFDGPGEAAFYAPKMDLMATDALGREWQLSTVQIDYVMPERFGLEYTDKDGNKKRPVMLHRAIVGSPERFLMILIEHYAGAFPLWLSPTQIVIISVGEKHTEHCQKLAEEFRAEDLRVEVWSENETVGNKIRKAIAEKIPYMLVVGDKELESDALQIRARGKEKTEEINKKEFIEKVKKLVEEKSSEL